MYTAIHQNQIKELLACLDKAAPKSCSKPKSEMCNKCVARVFSDRAIQIQNYIKKLNDLQKVQGKLTAQLETAVIELLNRK